ncbi:hypothetical protein APS56_02830 [Pseudalgibacter alginicilyticus]|uniref:GAF domain-containing protein n=1 Tax=Pseudalgibacter alginicilyticus TaxID=1736674 RepID=A0A0P0CID0_9FLAO|nr:hypothetical protein [Pseudalgibacter alginicilyticus]ALJ04148.1 hypothetical protein APS56_02830 [Pseudalgibacter alginicilyticus]
MQTLIKKGPFESKLSFRLLKEKFEELSVSNNPVAQFQSNQALELFKKHPFLANGELSLSECESHRVVIEQLMGYLFPVALTTNEIKTAIYPLTNFTFYTSARLVNILKNSIYNLDEIFKMLFKDHIDGYDLIPYAVILNSYYQYNIDLDRPKTLKIANKDGSIRNYRVTFNADFMEIYPNENAIEITPDVLDELLTDANNKDVWKQYFPDNSWTVEGFGIVTMTDTTLDETIDNFKTHLIQPNNESFFSLKENIRHIFGIPDLELGSYSFEHNKLIPPHPYDNNFKMLSIEKGDSVDCKGYACDKVYRQLFVENKPAILSNIERYDELTKGNTLSKTLLKQGFKSAVLIPIVIDGNLQFVIEMATYKTNQLNAINMVKMETLMPFILSYSARSITEFKNEVSAVIQQECTSIHPSVEWRFEEEASKFIQKRNTGENPSFNEIVFKDVLPLYGQIDIIGSSEARNKAIQSDLKEQLTQTKNLLNACLEEKKSPYYEQLTYQIDKFIYELDEEFQTNTEQEVNRFFNIQIFPLLEHLLTTNINVEGIKAFKATLDSELKTYYKARKEYDDTVDLTNKKLSCFIDKQQELAQAMFPHFFEKFKTDGVEHNLYIGQSITQNKTFHLTDLYNLRLWQLQVVCEMEAMYYNEQKEFPLQLDVASLILVYDVPLTIRYRMDEKQFDVDGAYNVRYEMIKKRIDKALIKNTNERLRQPNKLSVVYSSNEIEREYLNYFEFLQSKNYIGKNIEIVEIEELQGASGIKAIRVDINYKLNKIENLFNVNDLEIIE